MFKAILKTLIISCCILVLLNRRIYAVEIGPGNPNTGVSVVGDSFAGYFREFKGLDGFEYYIFPVGAINKQLNIVRFVDCIEHGSNPYILFCTGVNDYLLDTTTEEFEKYLRIYIQLAKNYNKYIFFHTYMNFADSPSHKGKASIESYNEVYKKLADEYSNAFYIEMSGMYDVRYMHSDMRHYAREFYDALYAKLMYLIDEINYKQYNLASPWIAMSDRYAMAVTGDSYAGTFVRYESGKYYYMTEFAKDGQTVLQNEVLINQAVDALYKYVLLSIGVNDYEQQSDTFIFEDTLRKFLNHACLNHKIVFLHSYMNYGAANSLNVRINRYDNILRELSYEYPNTIYIDMKAYEILKYQMPDQRHYGQEFNDKLYQEIDKLIVELNK